MSRALEYQTKKTEVAFQKVYVLVLLVGAHFALLLARITRGEYSPEVWIHSSALAVVLFLACVSLYLKTIAQESRGYSRQLYGKLGLEFDDPPLDEWSASPEDQDMSGVGGDD